MKQNALLSLTILLLTSSCSAQPVEEKYIRQHIKILASDSLQGRGTGTEGEKMAYAYIEKQFSNLKLAPKGTLTSYDQPFPFHGGTHGAGTEGIAHNIVAWLDNNASHTIVIGAHYDHLGHAENGGSLDANPQGKIHNGADDNASGTAGLLELARYFQHNRKREKYNFLFIAFSGEELGLLGSKYFTEHPTIDLAKVTCMINLDMIGRLDARTKSIAISGTGTSSFWEPELKKLSGHPIHIKTDSAGMGPSDHTSFYLKNIPVLHFFTGTHTDYHKPSDDFDRINYAGEKEVLQLIITIVHDLNGQPKLTFLPTKNKSMSSTPAFKVTLGIMPNYTESEQGLKVDGVSEGKPAQKAGILPGDVIIQIGDYVIKDIQVYMEVLGKFEKGQSAPIKVKRNEEVKTLNVTF